jgi:hypothetical protein
VNVCQTTAHCDFRVPPRAATGNAEPNGEPVPSALSPQVRALIQEGVEAIVDVAAHNGKYPECPVCDWVRKAKAMLGSGERGQAEPRLLADGEIIQRGDEFQDFDGAWKPVPDKMWGQRHAATVCPVRRPNAPRQVSTRSGDNPGSEVVP